MNKADNIRLQTAINRATDAVTILDRGRAKKANVNLAYSYMTCCLNQLLLFRQELEDAEKALDKR